MWSSAVFVCSLPGKHATATGFLTILLVSDFIFHWHLFLSEALHILSLFSPLVHRLHREGKGQCRHDFFFSPSLFLVYFTYQGTRLLPSRSCVAEGKTIQLSPHPPSILHVVDQADSASLKVIVAGVIPLGWMCTVCTSFFFPLQELKNNKKIKDNCLTWAK